MLPRVAEDPGDGFAQDRAEASGRVHGVLDEAVAAGPAPLAHHLRRGLGLVELDADGEGDVGAGMATRREERAQRGTVLDGASGEHVCVGVVAAVVPEQEVAEDVCAEDVEGVGCVEVLEVWDGEEDVADEGVCCVGGDELRQVSQSGLVWIGLTSKEDGDMPRTPSRHSPPQTPSSPRSALSSSPASPARSCRARYSPLHFHAEPQVRYCAGRATRALHIRDQGRCETTNDGGNAGPRRHHRWAFDDLLDSWPSPGYMENSTRQRTTGQRGRGAETVDGMLCGPEAFYWPWGAWPCWNENCNIRTRQAKTRLNSRPEKKAGNP